ncbi:MAG: hypothetical protein ACK5NF_04800 [Bacilli bacterium]
MKKVFKLSTISLLTVFSILITIYVFNNKNDLKNRNNLTRVVEKYGFELSEDPDGYLSILRQTGDYSGCGINEDDLSFFCSATLEGEMEKSYMLISSNDKVEFLYRDEAISRESSCKLDNERDLKEQVNSCDVYLEFSKHTLTFEKMLEDFNSIKRDMKEINNELTK